MFEGGSDAFRNNQLLLAIRCFRDPADEDYRVARWSYFQKLDRTFYWHAQQCIEKYLKCALLLNGQSVKEYGGHDTSALLEKAFEVFGSLISESISAPPGFPQIDDARLGFGKTGEIVEKYSRNGDPSNRYGIFSTDWNKIGLHSFDELIFVLRRVCGILSASDEEGKSLREKLESDVRYQISMDRIFESEEIRKMNFSFFPDMALNYGKIYRPLMPGFTNSPFYILVGQNSPEANSAIRWFMDNAILPNKARTELENHLRKQQS